jgi:T5SS/PEP-CTERM-associated repeat protein
MTVILQQQTFALSNWGSAAVSGGTAIAVETYSFAVALTGTLTQGATVTVTEQNPSHTVLTMTCTGTGTNNGFVLVDSGGNDFVFSNTSISVGSQIPATTSGFQNYQAPARTLVWTGDRDTSFANALNWNDTSNALNPAATAPGGADTAQFLGTGGTITGSGNAAALQFGGTSLWDVTSGAGLSAGTGITVGLGGVGTLLVNGGASIDGFGAVDTVSATSGNAAGVTVDGTGSAWQSAGELLVGDTGAGNVVISNKGSLSAAASPTQPALVLGFAAGGSGALTVTGTGSHATLTGQLTVGAAGAGSVTVSSQGTLTTGGAPLAPSQGIDVGQSAGGSGTITVSGTQSLLSNTGRFVVGDAGVGGLAILAGATVITSPGTVSGLGGLLIASTTSAAGSSVDVTGAGSNLTVTGMMVVGAAGSASLLIDGGATVTAGSLDAGSVAAAVGQIGVSGTGSALLIAGNAVVADDGTGVLSVLNGATFSASSLTIGNTGNSSGALVVSGAGSTVQLSGNLNIGTSLGTGDLTVGPNAAVHASVLNLQGQVVLEGGLLDPTVSVINQGQTAGGFGTLAAGDIVDEGVIQAGGSKPAQKLLLVQGTVLGGGTVTKSGTSVPSSPVGLLQINAGGTMELTGPVLNAATTTFTDVLTPTGTYVVTNSVIDVSFADAAGVLLLDDIGGFAGTVTAFKTGDQFVATGGTLSNLSVSNGNTLTFSDTGPNAGAGNVDQIIFASAVSPSQFDITGGDIVQAVTCFAAGTRIETESGPVPVQMLRIGDKLMNHRGESKPIVWIGQRLVDCHRHPRPETVWPIRVAAGTFSRNVPSRDLYLSPDHAVLVDDVLVPVKQLVNGTSIVQVRRWKVTYYHVELAAHDVILAEGLTVESYLDLGDRLNFHQGGEIIRLFPDLTGRFAPITARMWQAKGCAELLLSGERLAAIRRAVNATKTIQPDLRNIKQ